MADGKGCTKKNNPFKEFARGLLTYVRVAGRGGLDFDI